MTFVAPQCAGFCHRLGLTADEGDASRRQGRSGRTARPVSRLVTRAAVVDGGKNGAPRVAIAAFVEKMDGRRGGAARVVGRVSNAVLGKRCRYVSGVICGGKMFG